MTVIRVKTADQVLSAVVVPKLAPHNHNSVKLTVDFDSSWDGYGKSAMFFTKNNQTPYEKALDAGDSCLVPPEVLAEPGYMFVTIKGVKASDNSVKASARLKLNVSEGMPLFVVSEPTEDVYSQLLSAYGSANRALAVERERINNFAKLKEGSTTGDAELIDARVGADGTNYSTVGGAIRGQVESLSSAILSPFVETGFADKYITACKVFTDEYDHIVLSDIRRNYLDETSIRVYSSDETGESVTNIGHIVLSAGFVKGFVEFQFGENSFLRCFVDLTSLNDGERLAGVGKGHLLKQDCIVPVDDEYSANRIKTILLSACNTEPKKILTWIDDDTSASGIETAKTICDTVGVKCTFATITQNWTETLLETLHQYQKEGFHITSHTESHARWYKDSDNGAIFTAAELETDLIISLEKMRSEGFVDSDMLVYPGSSTGRNDVDVIGIAKKWCRCGVLAGGTNWGGYGQGKYKINRTFINKSSYDTSYYKGILDAVTDEAWVVFGSHSASPDEFDADMMTEILSYALDNGWAIMTLNEALKYRAKYYNVQEMFCL